MAPPHSERQASRSSETSPLLPKLSPTSGGDGAYSSTAHIAVENGIAPVAGGGGVDVVDDDELEGDDDGGDIERQITNGDSHKHQGSPEMRKRMKYIFPAIAIGVGQDHFS